MERIIWLVRHGESASNAGGFSRSPGCGGLSPRGKEHAEAVAAKIVDRPDLIVTSLYQRTVETADPLLKKFPEVKQEVWNIQEFTFLGGDWYEGRRQAERREPGRAYWKRCDPDFCEGRGAETFREFMIRMDEFLRRLEQVEDRFVVCFTHGYVIKTIIWRLSIRTLDISSELMQSFRDFHYAHIVGNGEVYPFHYVDSLVFVGQISPSNKVQALD